MCYNKFNFHDNHFRKICQAEEKGMNNGKERQLLAVDSVYGYQF